MKDASGASQMDPKTQVTSLHGVSMLDAAQYPIESNICLALLHEPGGENDRQAGQCRRSAPSSICTATPTLAAAQAARDAGNAPNSVLAAAASIVGPRRQEARARRCAS